MAILSNDHEIETWRTFTALHLHRYPADGQVLAAEVGDNMVAHLRERMVDEAPVSDERSAIIDLEFRLGDWREWSDIFGWESWASDNDNQRRMRINGHIQGLRERAEVLEAGMVKLLTAARTVIEGASPTGGSVMLGVPAVDALAAAVAIVEGAEATP